MTVEPDGTKFQRDKAVFEQNCLQLRALIQEFHKTPLMSATLTGGLLAVMSVFRNHDEQFEEFAVVVCTLIALFNAMIGLSCIRIRDVMQCYIEKASLFSEDFGERGGRPTKPILAGLGNFSIAIGYAILMFVVALTAIVLPFAAYGCTWFNALPLIVTTLGLSLWYGSAHLRNRQDYVDPVVAFYNKKGREYIEETLPLDLTDVIERFAKHLPTGGRVLDVGAGSGRDSKSFLDRGYKVVALEPSKVLAVHLRGIEGLEVREEKAQNLEEVETFDGIWACASLLHFDEKELAGVMKRLCRALKPNGPFYTCFKNGDGVRLPAKDGILFHDMTPDRLNKLVADNGLKVIEMWSNKSRLHGSNEAHWNNVIARKPF
ncbi:MAG: class I SAM-dependent methyltransferase [Alphaproteobacteria bacterium]|nr:class I SAM-dependent methyltransferase [Alphaproteobacteria bacterium]MBM3641099.1 class I SAM-dependent methyltransferase [Alphaproteobacteria bacterium]